MSIRKTITLKFVDFWPGVNLNFIKSDKGFGSTLLRKLHNKYIVKYTDQIPDILIYSVFGDEHNRSIYDSCTKLLYTAEWTPKYVNLAQYSISFMEDSTTNFRMPNYERINGLNCYKLLDKTNIDIQKVAKNKTKFCCFIVSNGNCIERNMFYNMLNSYKQVDSCGNHLKNIDFIIPKRDTDEYYEFLSQYKFMIAFENHAVSGYCTEKLYNAMRGLTIPIYWGDPDVGNIFNIESFINCSSPTDFGKAIEEIIKLDNDIDMYMNKLSIPYIKNDVGVERDIKFTEFINRFS